MKQKNLQRQTDATPDYDVCCPNCQARGDFLQEVNKVLKNCIDFCEFPHRCYLNDGRGEIIWKTLGELQAHAQYSCPKVGCDICYREEYQHLTRAQLYDHIKRDCPEVLIMCQVCNKEYPRAEFANHQCIKEFYVEKLTTYNYDVLNKLVDKLILHRRQQEGLGLCSKQECVDKHRNSGNKYQQSMIAQIQENTACKCYRCKNVIAGYEDAYFCIYCNEAYCPQCLGYCKWMDLEEMEQLLLK